MNAKASSSSYVIVVGAGKVGRNLTRELLRRGREVTLVESDQRRHSVAEQEFGHAAQYGDATEIWVLDRCGIARADLVICVTGDDEDNILIAQMAKEKYGVGEVIARVNNPRNRAWFDLLDVGVCLSSTDLILRLIEHELSDHGPLHLLDLPGEGLEIIELVVGDRSQAAGVRVGDLQIPEGARVISTLREGAGELARDEWVLRAGDGVMVITAPGVEGEVEAVFESRG